MLSVEALGHGYESMARPNFETVGFGVSVSEECPLDEVAAKSAAEPEFLRARIKIDNLASLATGGFWLSVDCISKSEPNAFIYSISMDWTWRQGEKWPERELSTHYGQTGKGVDGIKDHIGNAAEDGLTVYLRENLEQ
jgi:hypothetical protein